MSEAALARKTYLKKRGARWYCRVRVPADLVGQFDKTEIVESLQTSDYREACARVEAKVRDIFRNRQHGACMGDGSPEQRKG